MDERTLYFLIERLFADYCAALDEDELERWPELFVADGSYRMISRENFAHGHPAPLLWLEGRGMMVDRVYSLRNANIYAAHRYRHAQSAIQVLGEDDGGWRVRSSYIVVQTIDDGFSEVYQAGSYLDRLVMDDGHLRFRERVVVYDTARVKTLLATPV
ncbi:MAG: nuclear transport factor 2 family protein [Gammaproteobacteria bacterium]